MAIAQAKTPRAYINIKDLGFAVLTSDEVGNIKYDKVTQTRGLQEVSLETGGDIVNAYADGGIIESGNTDGEGKLNLTMHAFPQEIREIIFNEVYDEDGIYEELQGKQNNYVAVWFKRERRDGSFQRVGLTKVMFTDPKMEGKTAEEKWEFSQEEVEGTPMHRIGDGKRKIIFDSKKKDDDESKFFERLLLGAYTPSASSATSDAKVTTITLSPSSPSVAVDSTVQLTADVQPSGAANTGVTYSTQDTQYATVDADTGLVTGKAEGQATITATAKDGSGVTGTATVTVTPTAV